MSKRKAYDWEAIEREYRAGQLSIKEVARRYGCSDTAIRKKAKKLGWERDLASAIRDKVRNKLVREEVRGGNVSEPELIEQAAERGAQVVLTHRKDINRLRDLEAAFLEELSGSPTKLYITQYQGEIVSAEVGIPVTDKSAALNNLANVQHKRIQLERQAFNLNDSDDPADKPTDAVVVEIVRPGDVR